MAAAPGYSLHAKAVSCAVSVVKGRSCSRRSRYKPCTNREISVSVPTRVATNGLFLVNRFCYFSTFGKMTLPRLKSIPAGFCKLNRP